MRRRVTALTELTKVSKMMNAANAGESGAAVGKAMGEALSGSAFDVLFREARTHNVWAQRDLPEGIFEQLYDLVKFGPTSANSCPARFVFVRSLEAKERLRPHLSPGNVDKTMAAPCCIIVAYDRKFYDKMPELVPYRDVRPMFVADEAKAQESAFRNSSLQGGYLILAARALGLDTGAMQGFNRDGVDAEFFPDGQWTANFLLNIGYGDREKLFPRMPRLSFETACRVL